MRGLVLTTALCAFIVVPARAGLTIMHTANTSTGNQAWSSVGLEFTVNSAIRVVDLGVYDSGSDGIQGGATLSTVIFDAQENPLVQSNFTADDPDMFYATSNYLFKRLATPLVLLPGNYTIAAYGFASGNNEYNMNNNSLLGGPTFDGGGGSISFIQSVWGQGADVPPVFPTTPGPWSHAPDYFDGPNMIYAVVPLPASILLGVFAVGLAGRKLRKFV